jgi:DNA-3-methyladenine glycosylase
VTPHPRRVIGSGPVGRIRRLRRSELPDDTLDLARFLIGKVLVRDHRGDRTSGRIVETEAYPIGDAAGHAFIGMTAANHSLFLGKGHAYIYFIYGSSYMCNVAAERRGIGAGVLLRALEPLEGISVMQRRRGTTRLTELAKGPGRLANAMAIDLRCDGIDLCAAGPLWLGVDERRAIRPSRSVRIGLTKEVYRLLRFYERGNVYVSGPRKLRSLRGGGRRNWQTEKSVSGDLRRGPLRVLCHEYRRSKRRCATVREMKEGPSGSAIRSLIPSHRERLWSKAMVVSVAETLGR